MRHLASEVDGRECHFLGSFSKITPLIPGGCAWWRENQILQVNAHLLVPSRCPGKIGWASNFCSKGWSMGSKIRRSQKVSKIVENTSNSDRKLDFRDLGVACALIVNSI